MILSAVSDEISEDFQKSIEIGVKHGIYQYEIRNVDGYRFPFFPGRIYDLLINLKKEYGLTYLSVSPGIFKSELGPTDTKDLKEKTWDKIFYNAKKLGANRILIFAYQKCSCDEYLMMVEEIKSFSKCAENEGFIVSLENSPSTCCVTGYDLYRIIDDVGCKNLKANWDPANAGIAGHLDYEKGYNIIRHCVDNIHIKDVKACDDGIRRYCYTACGEGLMDLKKQLIDLKSDGYKGAIVLETHCKPLTDNFLKSFAYISGVINDI